MFFKSIVAIAFGTILNTPSVLPQVHESNRYPATDFELYCNTNIQSNFMAVLEDHAGVATAFFRDGAVLAISKKGEKPQLVGAWKTGPTKNDITITPVTGFVSVIYDLESKKCDYHFTK
tara:strand:+ start:750 stop:1106 length:357 start_codon:yes stop_codon:yes gene_type:complete